MNSSIDHVENARLDQKNRVPSGKRKSVDSENPEPHAELGNDKNQFYSRKKKSRREERDEDELCSAAKLVQCTADIVHKQDSYGLDLTEVFPEWCDRPLVVKELLREEENFDKYNYIAGLPLVAVSAEGKTSLVQAMLRHGCDVNVQDKRGNTALHLSAKYGRTEIVDILLNAGAKLQYNKKGLTPLDLATEKRYEQIVHLLKQQCSYKDQIQIYGAATDGNQTN